MYGIKGNKDDGSIGRAADVLNDDGYVVITIDWPGTGERGNIGNTDRITNPDVKDWTVGDYAAALSYLQSLPEVDGNRIGYVGASMGAMTGLALAARDQRVKAIAAIVPIPNPLWGEDDPSSRITQLGRPVLCISTSDNSDFSGIVCQAGGAGVEAKTLPGGHELEGFKDEVVAEVKAFLAAHLKP
jgi:dienelactone hydrolase